MLIGHTNLLTDPKLLGQGFVELLSCRMRQPFHDFVQITTGTRKLPEALHQEEGIIRKNGIRNATILC